MGINQKGPTGAFEDRVLQRGGFNTPLGNKVARNVAGGGPGAGRDVQRSGSQGTHGSVNPGSPRPGPSPSTDDYYYNKRG
jgi:hypothetical protein